MMQVIGPTNYYPCKHCTRTFPEHVPGASLCPGFDPVIPPPPALPEVIDTQARRDIAALLVELSRANLAVGKAQGMCETLKMRVEALERLPTAYEDGDDRACDMLNLESRLDQCLAQREEDARQATMVINRWSADFQSMKARAESAEALTVKLEADLVDAKASFRASLALLRDDAETDVQRRTAAAEARAGAAERRFIEVCNRADKMRAVVEAARTVAEEYDRTISQRRPVTPLSFLGIVTLRDALAAIDGMTAVVQDAPDDHAK